jgi:hypothetical protein
MYYDRSMNLQDLTVIIWTSCQRAEIKQICDYWIGNGAKILILATDISIYRLLNNTKVETIYINPDMGERLNFASKNIFTTYCILHGDDDLALGPSVSKGIKLLEKRQKIDAVFGEVQYFSQVNGFEGFMVTRRIKRKQQKNIIHRLSAYQFLFIMALHRTEKFKLILETVSRAYKITNLNQCDAVTVELGIEICSTLSINFKKVSNIFMLKQTRNVGTNTQLGSIEWIRDSKNKSILIKWVTELIEGLNLIDIDQAQRKKLTEETIFSLELFSLLPHDSKGSLGNRIKFIYLTLLKLSFFLAKKIKLTRLKFYVPGINLTELKTINTIFGLK